MTLKPIYLDYAATTPVDPRVVRKMETCLLDAFGNPASQHSYGEIARELIETARFEVASLIGATASEIIWTSGATESINLAIKGCAHLYSRRGKHIITMKTEHKAVLDVCQYLEKKGYFVTYLSPERNGLLDIEKLKSALRDDTLLVSIMQVNNETGIIQDLETISQITTKAGVLLHVDAAQSIGKIALDVNKIPVDLVSMSAHKVYGPKGIGALYLRKKPRVRVEALIHGGGHEQGMRSGTLATHQIVGMGAAFQIAQLEMKKYTEKVQRLRDRFIAKLTDILNLRMNTDLLYSVPHILNLRFDGMLSQALLKALPMIAASTASACQGMGAESSYVLRAMGLSDDEAKSSVRFSFGRFTTDAEIDQGSQAIYRLFFP